jgi:hypothetical protein
MKNRMACLCGTVARLECAKLQPYIKRLKEFIALK